MKTKIILIALLVSIINFLIPISVLAVENPDVYDCVKNGRTCVDKTGPSKPACPAGMRETTQYICQSERYHVGVICCEATSSAPAAPNSSLPSGDTLWKSCEGRKYGDYCLNNKNIAGECIYENGESGKLICSSSAASSTSGSFPTSSSTQSGSLPPELYIPTSGEIGLPSVPGGITQIIRTVLTWALGIVGLLALIGFIVSGIQYMLAAGVETDMQKAKRNMTYSIYGIAIALSGVIIIRAIFYALSGFTSF